MRIFITFSHRGRPENMKQIAEKKSKLRKIVSVLVSTSLFSLGVFAFTLFSVPPAMAAVEVGENLSLYGDFRMRYEIDDEHRFCGVACGGPAAGVTRDRERDRARIRARFGFKYQWRDNISFGMRLRTSLDSVQSPHQTLGLLQGRGTNFGLDRAYIHFKFLDGGFLWLGKNQMSFWQQNEVFWDGDAQPEGGAIGYKYNLAAGGSITVQAVHTWFRDNGFGDLISVGEDETGTTIQGVFVQPLGSHVFTLAAGAMFVNDDQPQPQPGGGLGLPGGDATYFIGSFQWKTKFAGIGFKLGADYLNSSVDNDQPMANTAHVFWLGADDQNDGYVINFAAKWKKLSFKFEHYYVELNAVPLQGAVAQDDFRFSSNFEGQKYQIGYQFGKGLSADFRVYDQHDILDRDLPDGLRDSSCLSSGADCAVVGTGGFVQDVEHNIRYQINLNIKF